MKSAVLLFAVPGLLVSCNSQDEGIIKATDGAPIYYHTFGSGAPLLIINGGPGMNSNGFQDLAKKLSENRMTIIYDQRGTGKSALPKIDSTTVTMQLMAEDIETLRKHLGIEKWSVLGHSFGGMVASYYAAKYPGSIDKLVLSSSGGVDLGLLQYVGTGITSKLSSAQRDSLNYWNNRISAGDTSHYAKLERGKILAHAYILDEKYLPVIAERLTQSNNEINMLVWASLQKIQYDCTPLLKNYTKPVLIIQGKEDIIQPETAGKSHQAFKNSRVVFVDHCIHYGWLDNPEVYLGEVNKFLASPGF